MDRQEQIRRLLKAGFVFLRSGAKQDLYLHPKSGRRQVVPRPKKTGEQKAKRLPKTIA